jgi:tripartite-type tricarboxylate transporter receptor subunit TctC
MMHMTDRPGAWVLSFLVMIGGAAVWAQEYPSKPIRIITGDAGGAVDFTARVIALGIASPIGQQVIVENRGGAGGAIAIGSVARAAPDGYTGLAYSSAVWIVPLLQDKVAWDPLTDFSPVTMADKSPGIVVVHPSLPARTVKELIALAKARPGALNYASVGSGSHPHLATELFNSMAGVHIVHVPYKGTAPGVNDLISGQVQMMIAVVSAAVPHVKSGRLRALAVTSLQPSALLPGLPTVAESGLPGYESIQMFGIYVPAKTPAGAVAKLNQEIVRTLHRTDTKEKLLAVGLEVVGDTPEQFAATIKADMAKMGKVIRDAKIRAD